MKRSTIKIGVIKIQKVAIGHQDRPSGTGVHQDKRTRRVRTRAAKSRQAFKEYQ